MKQVEDAMDHLRNLDRERHEAEIRFHDAVAEGRQERELYETMRKKVRSMRFCLGVGVIKSYASADGALQVASGPGPWGKIARGAKPSGLNSALVDAPALRGWAKRTSGEASHKENLSACDARATGFLSWFTYLDAKGATEQRWQTTISRAGLCLFCVPRLML